MHPIIKWHITSCAGIPEIGFSRGAIGSHWIREPPSNQKARSGPILGTGPMAAPERLSHHEQIPVRCQIGVACVFCFGAAAGNIQRWTRKPQTSDGCLSISPDYPASRRICSWRHSTSSCTPRHNAGARSCCGGSRGNRDWMRIDHARIKAGTRMDSTSWRIVFRPFKMWLVCRLKRSPVHSPWHSATDRHPSRSTASPSHWPSAC